MSTDSEECPGASALTLPRAAARALAETPTRLAAMPHDFAERLVNFGSGMAERTICSVYDPHALAAADVPHPDGI